MEILTPKGFKKFDGIKRYWHKKYLRITLSTDKTIDCAYNHKFVINDTIKLSKHLNVGDFLSDKGRIKKIDNVSEGKYFYDPVNVDDGKIYLHDNGLVSHNTFFGTGNTLIAPDALMKLKAIDPMEIAESGDCFIYSEPDPTHGYILVADVGKGRGQDFSAFSVIDITTRPFKQVAMYRNNNISPLLYPNIIYKYAKLYNEAYVIIESNDQGWIVGQILHHELEYENLHLSRKDEGRKISQWVSRPNQIGIETTKKTKRLGCSSFKDLIEEGKLEVCDEETIVEISTFEEKGASYEAAEGCHDDIVMGIVLFSYFVSTQGFKNLTDINIRDFLYQRKIKDIEEEVPPSLVIDNHVNELSDETDPYPPRPGEQWSIFYDETGSPMGHPEDFYDDFQDEPLF